MQQGKQTLFDQSFLARLDQLHLIAKRLAGGTSTGLRKSRRIGDGLEFADHRAYASGDDLRFIDWPYYARMEKLLLRMFHEHSEADVTIMLDTSASMATGSDCEKFNYARRVAAALAYVAMGSLERVILQPFGEQLGREMRTARNRSQVIGVLDFLSELNASGKTNLENCARQFAHRRRQPQTVLILSDLLDCSQQLPKALARLRIAGHEVTVLHLYAPQDASPAASGPVQLKDAEDGREMPLNITNEVLQSYHRSWEEFCSRCRAACIAREAIYISAVTTLPFEQLILQTLRKAGVLVG